VIKRILLAFLFGVVSFSLSSCITAMEWSTEDEDDLEYKPPKAVNVSKKITKEKNTPEYSEKEIEDEDLPDIYEITVGTKNLDELDILLRSELEEANFKIIKVSHVSDGMEEQGRKDFWKDMNIYLICRLSDGYFILKRNPHLVGFCPYRIYTYRNKEGFLVVGFVKPSIAVRYMGTVDIKAVELLKKHDLELKRILDSLNN
jgi:uncharacterized protein (DUF302 family)